MRFSGTPFVVVLFLLGCGAGCNHPSPGATGGKMGGATGGAGGDIGGSGAGGLAGATGDSGGSGGVAVASGGLSGTGGTSTGGAGGACPVLGDAGSVRPPSCDGLADTCGPCGNESCCTSPLVTGGSFYRSYDGARYVEQIYPATVSDVRLDRFEVTVGRFRRFVNAVVGGWRPPAGSGKHVHLNGGAGVNPKDAGWDVTGWTRWLPTTKASWDSATHLACDASYSTWTPEAGANENRAINCVAWFEAYAFCIWDGAFLPTEAEWNYAAAGGNEQREYPWGATLPSPSLAVYYCENGGTPGCSSLNVGSRTAGDGRFRQADLAGSVWEWNLDAFIRYKMDWSGCSNVPCTDYPLATCNDCAYLATNDEHVVRGGSYYAATQNLRSSLRMHYDPNFIKNDIGMRCARAP